MAIFSGFLKSGQDLPGARTVPNGGLGGLVQITASDDVSDGVQTKGYAGNGDKKRPPPMRLRTSEVIVPPSPAPSNRISDEFPKSLRTPRTAVRTSRPNRMSTRNTHSEVQNSPRPYSREDGQFLHPLRNVRSVSSPKGFGNGTQEPFFIDIPALPPTPDRGARSSIHVYPHDSRESRTIENLSGRITSSQLTRPRSPRLDDMDGFRSAIRSTLRSPNVNRDGSPAMPKMVTRPSASSPPRSPNPLSKDISTLSAHELLVVLPKLKSNMIINAWIPAMEKEFGKIKALADKFDIDKTQESRIIKIFSEDMRNLLRQSKEIAARYDEEFTKAQAAIDANRQTDLDKLKIAEDRLHETVVVYSRKLRDNTVEDVDSHRVQSSLIYVNTILGGFIRNNLANTLHNSEDGLTQEVIRLLTAFDRTEPEANAQTPADQIPAARYDSICRNLFESQEKILELQTILKEYQALATSNSRQLEKLTEQLQSRAEENRKADREIASLRRQLENEKAQNDVYREIVQGSSNLKNKANMSLTSDTPARSTARTMTRDVTRPSTSIGQQLDSQPSPVNAHQTPMSLSLGTSDHVGSRDTVLYRPRNVFSVVPMSPVSPRSTTYDHSSGSEDEARSASISSIASGGGWPYTSMHDPILSPVSRPHSPTEEPPVNLTRQQSTLIHCHHENCRPLELSKKEELKAMRDRAESITGSDEWEYDWE